MPPALVASCVERAEGNPLFLLQLLLDAGEGGAGEPAGLDPGARPHAHGPPRRRDKAALQAAAVLGQRFAMEALRHLLDEPATTAALLVEHFLVRADGGEFMFCHALIRDGAYASLLHKRRRAGCTPAPPSGSRRATSCSPPSTSIVPTMPRAAAAYLDCERSAGGSSSATPRRSRWSSAASRSRSSRRRDSPC